MTDQPEKFDLRSHDIAADKQAALRAAFPEAFTESGKIDFERLKLALGETIDSGKERYGMNWPGKADCFKTIQQPSMATLVPVKDESESWDTTENLIIEGDNLEVLKLLQKSYLGRVKMIYIDPPYNTGNDFIYPDNYAESLETYLRYTGQVDSEGRKYATNTEADGRFHSKWLNMMYPRLYLARNLLREDGIIFISIDDAEVDNLRKLCGEIFGEETFVASAVWQKRYSRDNRPLIGAVHEYILIYCRNKEEVEKSRFLLPPDEESQAVYKNPNNDPKGRWRAIPMTAQGFRPNQMYPITAPAGVVHRPPEGRCWSMIEERFLKFRKEGRIWFGNDGRSQPGVIRYLSEIEGFVPWTWWPHGEVGHTDEAKKEIHGFFGKENAFDTPKPVRLLNRIAQIATREDKDAVVLDFFAGSGTTAQALLELNKEDGGSRKFVLVQLPEKIETGDLSTIAEITKERVRHVIKKLNTEDAGKLVLESGAKPDRGFKVFKLQSSNFKTWNAEVPKEPEIVAEQLEMHVHHIVEGRTSEDILFEILLKSGFPLATPIETLTLAGQTVFSIAEGAMLICLEKKISSEVIKEMADRKPERVVCLDEGFAGNDQLKTNAVQTMKTKGVTSFRTV